MDMKSSAANITSKGQTMAAGAATLMSRGRGWHETKRNAQHATTYLPPRRAPSSSRAPGPDGGGRSATSA
eukprot:13282499-Alexandrium_andersonii.AAC.1